MLKCIKASITPVSCKLKNPLKTSKNTSYNIIHKAEKQLLYEHIRNINNILDTLNKQRETQYKKFNDMQFKPNLHVQDPTPNSDLDRSRMFINKIKEHRHNKTKRRQIDKFDWLYFKHNGYHHNLTRQASNLKNIDQQNTLGGHQNVPSSFSSTSSQSTVPVTPMAPIPSTSTAPAPDPAPRLPPSSSSDTCTDQTNKWVINLSQTPVTMEQLSLLQKRPNYAITPQIHPIEAYISAVEQASSKLPAKEADEFRSDVNKLLKQQQQSQCNNQCNLNLTQHRALTQLKQDNSRVVLTADKGVAMVIMGQEDDTNKAQILLQDTNSYKILKKDPTSHLKNKLISLLKDIKQTGGLSTNKYKQLYPTSAVPPKFYGLPKIHKVGTPLRPIVSSRGSIAYGVAKELAYIIKPLVGQSPHHLKNTQHFIQQLQGKKLEPGEVITSFDVKALFTSVSVHPAIQIVKQRLQQDTILPQRTSMSIPQITSLLEFCLTNTYFLFWGKYYEQVQGAAMGSPISPS